jgi:hypothetical protein
MSSTAEAREQAKRRIEQRPGGAMPETCEICGKPPTERDKGKLQRSRRKWLCSSCLLPTDDQDAAQMGRYWSDRCLGGGWGIGEKGMHEDYEGITDLGPALDRAMRKHGIPTGKWEHGPHIGKGHDLTESKGDSDGQA